MRFNISVSQPQATAPPQMKIRRKKKVKIDVPKLKIPRKQPFRAIGGNAVQRKLSADPNNLIQLGVKLHGLKNERFKNF